jgi:hypothetical protein
MQLAPVLAQPPAEKSAGLPKFLNILTTLRGEKPAEAAAAAPAPAPAPAAPQVSAAVEQSQPSLGAKLLGGLATNQSRYIQNQQALAAISAGLTAHFSTLARNVWAHLRGTDAQAPEAQAAQAAQQVQPPTGAVPTDA